MEQDKEYEKEINVYYDECSRDYEIVWQLNDALALHYGFWDENTLTHRQALWNMNFQVARHAQIREGERVLDAGCGVGGTAFLLATHFHCQVEGISIIRWHINRANAMKAKQKDIENRVSFSCQDYRNTNFADESFDVIIGIESICHATPKSAFLNEAFRLLKPGGRLVMTDYFLRATRSEKEARTLKNWSKAWAINDFIVEDEFLSLIKETGFQTCMVKDLSRETLPSVKLMHRSYYPGVFISKISNFIGRRTNAQVENSKSGKFQYQSYRQGVWNYKILLAIKPPVANPVTGFDQFITREPAFELFVDRYSFKERFPVITPSGVSYRNLFKRLMHWYLETGIRNNARSF